MLKLELLLRRIRGFDAKRMMVYVRDVKKETKTPTPVIMADMLYCILRYNVGFYDYHIFGFAHIHGAKARSTFFTMQDNWRLTRMVNSPEDRPYFENLHVVVEETEYQRATRVRITVSPKKEESEEA